MENKVFGITSSLKNIRSFNIMMRETWFSSKKTDEVPCCIMYVKIINFAAISFFEKKNTRPDTIEPAVFSVLKLWPSY